MKLQPASRLSRFYGFVLAGFLLISQVPQPSWASETHILTPHQGYRPVITLEQAIDKAREEAIAEDAAEPLEKGSMGRVTYLHSESSDAAAPVSGEGEAAAIDVPVPASGE